MDIFCDLFFLFFIYIVLCVLIVLFADSDILTFLYSKFGKDPKNVYNEKVVWITGASSGIGEAISIELAKHGAKLILSARRIDELSRVKQLCLGVNPEIKDNDVLVLPFDMVDLEAHEKCFKKILEHFGKLDVLVSNAGRSQRANWHEIQLSVDKELFELNVFSLVNLNRIAVKYFLENGGGHVVVNSSMAGVTGFPYSASYTASKHALQGYFKGLRNEVRLNDITVTILLPGPTFSNFLSESFTAETGKKFGKQTRPNDNRMTAERCAYLAVVAMANKIEEVWIGFFPYLPMLYLNAYLPYLESKCEYILCKFGYFMKLRDGRETLTED